MKTRYSSLVSLKKGTMDKSERVVQKANTNLNSASSALENSYASLQDIEPPTRGNITQLLASRTLFASQREIIQHNQEWLNYAKNQVELAKKQLNLDIMDYEKMKYLEFQEVKKKIEKQKMQEAKDLDEIASITYSRNKNKKV